MRKWNDFLEDNKISRNESDIFGIEFFKSFQSTFSPINNPNFDDSYIVDYGDYLLIQIIGQMNTDKEVEVLRDGTINIPKIGSFTVAGLPISKIYELVKAKKIIAYKYKDFWYCMDNLRDKTVLENLYKKNKKTW